MFRVPKEAVDTLLSLVFFMSTADAIDGARWPSTLSFSSLYAVRGPADSLVAFESVRAAAAYLGSNREARDAGGGGIANGFGISPILLDSKVPIDAFD